MDDPIVNWIDDPEPELDVEPGSDWELPTVINYTRPHIYHPLIYKILYAKTKTPFDIIKDECKLDQNANVDVDWVNSLDSEQLLRLEIAAYVQSYFDLQEAELRTSIIPQLESLANNLWDTGNPSLGRKLDNIVDEIRSLLDAKNE